MYQPEIKEFAKNEETINIEELNIPRKDISLIKIKYNW